MVELNQLRADHEPSIGVRLLADVRAVFGAADKLPTATLLDRLHDLDEAPRASWAGGRPLDARRLADQLREYGVNSKVMRVGDLTPRGYTRADLHDARTRYLPPPGTATGATAQQPSSQP